MIRYDFQYFESVRDRCEIGARSVRKRSECEFGANMVRRQVLSVCSCRADAGQNRCEIGARSVYSVKISGLRCTRPYSVYSAMLGSCSIMVRAVLIHDARAVLNLVRYSSVDTRIRYSG